MSRKPLFPLVVLLLCLGCGTNVAEKSDSNVAEETPALESNVMSDDATEADKENGEEESAAPAEDSVILIDVRSQGEWDKDHIKDSIHIPHTEIADKIAGVTTDKSRKIVVYCAAGVRAETAKDALVELGYTNVENGGGIEDVKDDLASK